MGLESLLLVEDDATTREVLTLLLEADGWTVEPVSAGEAALEFLRFGVAAVVLCDLHLPGVQGAALADALRAAVPGAVLVAMSATPAEERSAGYDAVLRKPFGAPELRGVLSRLSAAQRRPAGAASVAVSDAASAQAGTAADDAAETYLAVLRSETFLKLEQQMGVRVRELYAFALADAGDRIRRIEQSLASGDVASVQREAHQLKGSAGMIGAERLQALASEAESGSDGDYLGKKVWELHRACDEIRLMLETLFPM